MSSKSVKDVLSQLSQIIKIQIEMSHDKDPKKLFDSSAVVTEVFYFRIIFGLETLHLNLTNTSSLHSYLQRKMLTF